MSTFPKPPTIDTPLASPYARATALLHFDLVLPPHSTLPDMWRVVLFPKLEVSTVDLSASRLSLLQPAATISA